MDLVVGPMNKLDNDEHGRWTLGLCKESGTNRFAFQRFDKFEPGQRVVGYTIGVNGGEKMGIKFLWDVGVDFERSVVTF